MLTSIRQLTWVRFVAVLAALTAWVFLSSRCLLGVAAHAVSSQVHACCESSTSADPKPEPQPMVCCKTLAVTTPEAAQASVAPPVPTPLPDFICTIPERLECEQPVNAAWEATGPPGEDSGFTELVLHRSLQAHAPPVRC